MDLIVVQISRNNKWAQIIDMSRRNAEDNQLSSEEAEEVQDEVEEEVVSNISQSEGEDLFEDPERDYQSIEELDRYEDDGVDHEQIDLNPEARLFAQKELNRRDRRFIKETDQVEQYLEEQEEKQQMQIRQERRQFYQLDDDQGYNEDNDQAIIDAEDQRSNFEEWFNLDGVRKYIKYHFIKFLDYFQLDGEIIYSNRLKKMCQENQQSIEIDFNHFKEANSTMASWFAFNPIKFIPEINTILYTHACKRYPSFKSIISECFVKFYGVPVTDKIRQLSYHDLGKIIRIKGMVTARCEVYSQLKKIFYKCYRCGLQKGPFFVNNLTKIVLGTCYSCQSNGPFLKDYVKSVYRNYQAINIQQSPSDVVPGRIPRSKEALLFGDNIDLIKPGDEVQVVGIYIARYECALNVKQGFPVFNTLIEVNSIRPYQELRNVDQIDQRQFQQFSKMPDFDKRFYNTLAPSIYGHSKVKRAIAMSLFGGVEKLNSATHHRTRGDINVLLLGDPGIAKSQFLKSVQKVFHRCIYTTGKGASAVGLTACVKKDHQTNQWKLEAGALVLADRGVCLIDEFDKMTEQDRTSIHEAMQQQTISISKAGIVATLNARCSVIAAANPLSGRYNEAICFKDNINLTDPILSRFDILNVIKDKCNESLDERIGQFVINQHLKSHPYRDLYQIQEIFIGNKHEENQQLENEADFIKKYIRYARENFSPKLSTKSSELIKTIYKKLRKSCKQSGGMYISVRHMESMVRICEAHAKMHLRKQTNEQDAKIAIRVILQSFIDTQKHSTAEKLRKQYKHDLND